MLPTVRTPAWRRPWGSAIAATLLGAALFTPFAPSAAAAACVVNPTPPAEFRSPPSFEPGAPDTSWRDVLPESVPFRPFADRGLARDSARTLAGAVGADEPDSTTRPVEYLWVLRDQLIRRDDIVRLVERARAMRVRGLLVQVVGRGDAWYRSDLLPPPEPLGASAAARDPLGELVPLAHAAGLEVHAWVVACLVWSGDRKPRDPRHVLNAHPEWIARTEGGRALSSLRAGERERMGVEGAFLSPAHPRVREWVARVAQEIVLRYAVDGIHLDYIRQPSVDVGFDQTSRANFALQHGLDPARFGQLPAAERRRAEQLWVDFQRDQVTAIVRAVRDSVNGVRPGVELSAAVFADTVTALRRIRQPWMDWLRDGLLDRAFTMSYATSVQTVVSQLVGYTAQLEGLEGRLVPGIALYNAPVPRAAAKIKAARELGFRSIALYSYDWLWRDEAAWGRLLGYLAPTEAAELDVGR